MPQLCIVVKCANRDVAGRGSSSIDENVVAIADVFKVPRHGVRVVGHTLPMDPDQWFRLWLALGQGAIGGVVTLLGGYVGYRLAGRAERNKHKMEALRNVNQSLRDLTRFTQEYVSTEPLGLVMGVLQRWSEVLEDDPPPKGTPANIIGVEALVGVLEVCLIDSQAFDAGRDLGRAPADQIVSAIRKSRAECSRWVTDGPPPSGKLMARHTRALKRRDAIMAEMEAISAERQQRLAKPPHSG